MRKKSTTAWLGKNGFTLIELLIVIVLIGILTSIAIASLHGYTRRQTLSQAAKGLEADLRATRNKAISGVDGVRWGVHLEAGSTSYKIFSPSPIGDSFAYSTGQVKAIEELPSQVTIADVSPTTNVVFDRLNGEVYVCDDDGAPSAPPLVVTLRLSGISDRYVRVEAGGKIYETD